MVQAALMFVFLLEFSWQEMLMDFILEVDGVNVSASEILIGVLQQPRK